MPKGKYKKTKEHCLKIGLANKGRKHFNRKSPPPFTEEHKRKMKEKNSKTWFQKGHKPSLQTRLKMSISRTGKPSNKKGKKASNETKERMSLAKKNQYKDKQNHPRWKGGISRDKHGGREVVKWRSQIFERDNWTCQTCRIRGTYLEAHHIKSWAKFPQLRFELSNGVTLCRECHKMTDNYKGKNKKK